MLSEEQAIENLKDFKSISILYGNTFTMFLEQLKKYQEATDTVLNLITKLQKENEEKDKQIDLMAFSLADYVMYYEYDKCRNPEMIKQKAEQIKQCFETKAKKGE